METMDHEPPQPRKPTRRRSSGTLVIVLSVVLCAGWVVHRTVLASRLFAARVQAEKRLLVWEGLPHPTWENKLFDEERTNKPIRELDSYLFYAAPLELDAEDDARLRALLTNPGSYQTFWPLLSAKKCGSFHPDFAVELPESGQFALLCFGCGEVELRGGWLASKHDLSAALSLHELLSKYRTNRPPSDAEGADDTPPTRASASAVPAGRN